MMYEKMPIGYPVYFEGKYEYDPVYPLYVQTIECEFEIKPNKIPTIQIRHTLDFLDNEYVTTSNHQRIVLTMTNVDLQLFYDHYNIINPKYLCGWKFRGSKHIFDSYINFWTEEKITAGKEGNKGKRQIAKLMLNSLYYGRFGISLTARQKAPYLDDNGNLRYYNLPPEEKSGLYLPVASYVTSYGRNKTIRTAQAVRDFTLQKYGIDKWLYCDTDSVKANLTDEDLNELKDIIDIDDYALGKWALEEHFEKFLGLRQKCYITQVDGKTHVTVAGLPQ